jgi:hypothetical protein
MVKLITVGLVNHFDVKFILVKCEFVNMVPKLPQILEEYLCEVYDPMDINGKKLIVNSVLFNK